MTVKVIATRCGIPGTRGHWPGCWGPPVTTNVRPRQVHAQPGRRLLFMAPSPTQFRWHGRQVIAAGVEGRSLAVRVA